MKVSILIPVYNAEKHLCQCLESCLAQSPFQIGKDYEIICVNDGSKDNSNLILEKYSKKGIKVISQANSGVSAARNNALDNAIGEFVWFVDSDDIIQTNVLSFVYKELKKKNADGCTLKMKFVKESFELDHTNNKPKILFDEKVANMSNVSLIIAKRSYINCHKIRFNEKMSYGEDTLFMYHMRLYEHYFINTPNVLYYYRQVPTSVMHQKDTLAIGKSLQSALVMLDEFKAVLDNWDSDLYKGDAKTQERYYWTVQNILFILLRIDKSKRNKIFQRLEKDGHYPYPIQFKRLMKDSKSIKAFLLNGFCLLFPLKCYYRFISFILK